MLGVFNFHIKLFEIHKNALLLCRLFQVYQDIRDRHFSNVFTYLSAKAKDLQSGYDVSHLCETTVTLAFIRHVLFIRNGLGSVKYCRISSYN